MVNLCFFKSGDCESGEITIYINIIRSKIFENNERDKMRFAREEKCFRKNPKESTVNFTFNDFMRFDTFSNNQRSRYD